MKLRVASALACASVLITAAAPANTHAQDKPALVVLITVDQLRNDYMERFAPNLTGGLKRFREQSAYFLEGRHDHANSSTAPGHATLLSGRVPASTGILSNDLGVPDAARRLIAGATATAASPFRFRGTTLFDWMRAVDPNTRALSVSRKDRGAILPIGSARTNVYWWANARFTTSNYYADTLPTWVTAWNARFVPADWEGRDWTLLLPESAYPEPDDESYEGVGARRGRTFPHRLANVNQLINFPWIDSLTLDLALDGVRALELGKRGSTDLLSIALSATDAIGHHFGPDSREVHDMTLRVDRWLGTFMTALEQHVPRARIVYVLTSDHGVGSMPERLQARGQTDAGHIDVRAAVTPLIRPLQERFAYDFGFNVQSGTVIVDTAGLRARGVDVAQLRAQVVSAIKALPGIDRVYTPQTLAAAPPSDEFAGLWRRAIPPSYGWLAATQPRDGWVFVRAVEAEHGTPLLDHRRVPIAFMAPGINATRIDRVVRTVDIGPTLAALLGVTPTEWVDGVPLPEVVRPRRQ